MTYKLNPFTGKLDTSEGPQGPAGVVSAAGPGSQATPSISFAADLDTGLYNYAANGIAVSTGGTGRLFVNSSGLVGIGNSNPSNLLDLEGITPVFRILANGVTEPKLQYQSRGGATTTGLGSIKLSNVGDLIFGTGTSSESERLRITSDGKLGLGITTPQNLLHLRQSSGDAVLRIENDGTNGNKTGIRFQNSNDVLNHSGGIYCIRNGGTDHDLLFQTYGSGAGNTRMTIKNDGNVGIGTSSPGSILETATSAGTACNVILRTGDSSAGAYNTYLQTAVVAWQAGITANTDYQIKIEGGETGYEIARAGTAIDSHRFSTAGSERARIDSSGRLLVGTSSAPSHIILGGSITPQIHLSGVNQAKSAFGLVNYFSGGSASSLILGSSKGGTIGTQGIVADGGELGRIAFTGSDGSNLINAATVNAFVDGTPGADDMPGRLVFSTTADGASSPTERMRITSNGTVIFGSTGSITAPTLYFLPDSSGGYFYKKANSTNARNAFVFENPNGVVGSIVTSASATAFNTSSDYRLKENIVPLTGAADRVNQLQVHRFNFIADPDTTVDGFIAHEAQAVVPECVTGTKDEVDDEGNPVYQGIDQSKLVPLLTAALQEALAKIETLEQRLSDAGIA